MVDINDFLCRGANAEINAGVTWLGDIASQRNDWQARFNRVHAEVKRQIKQIDRSLSEKKLPTNTSRRLTLKRDGLNAQNKTLEKILLRCGINQSAADLAAYTAMQTPLPATQGLISYYPNIHRDWNWGTEENQLSVEAILQAAGKKSLGRLLVLGSGAGRLAYDLHQAQASQITVALDINPLLAHIGHMLSAGEEIVLPEFPIAPISIEDVAPMRRLKAPQASRPGLSYAIGDAFTAPLAKHKFDTILTPWFTDIVPVPLPQLCARLHSLLATEGRWINFGSHTFQAATERDCLSLEESLQQVSEHGFSFPECKETIIPYMDSPASRHGRREQVITWICSAQSSPGMAINQTFSPANWLTDTSKSIPCLDAFQLQAMSTKIHAYVMSLIDGKRSIEDIARVMDKQNIMPANEAIPTVRRFINKMWEEAETPRG